MNSKEKSARFHGNGLPCATRQTSGSIAIAATVLLIFLGVTSEGCGQGQNPAPGPRKVTPGAEQSQTPPSQAQPISRVDSAPGSKLPLYELKIAPRDLARLEQTAFSNETVPATFTAGGQVYDGVRVRYRGAWARSWPKKPLKIFFDKAKPFEGQSAINLNSGWRDPAFIREHIAYLVYTASGVPASRTRMVRLHVNGQFRGLYVEVEQPEKEFVARLNLKGASVYKANSRANQADERMFPREASYQQHYEMETRKADGFRDLQLFCQELARTTNVLDFFNRRVDLDKYVNYLAATALVQNWDGYNKNHFLVYDGRGSQKWIVVPWDLDRTLGDHWTWSFDEAHLPAMLGTRQLPGVTGWNRLQDRFFSEPTLRLRFANRLQELLEKEFTKEQLFPIVDQLEADIGPEAALDRRRWPSDTPELHTGIVQLKRFIERRRAFLLREVARLRRGETPP